MLLDARLSRWVLVASMAVGVSCSSSQRRVNSVQGNAGGPVRTFTDSDLVTDVAASEGHVFVGTNRGVLRYGNDGGQPTRLTRADGLPGDDVLALALTEDGTTLWVATPGGIVRRTGDARFERAGVEGAQPDVGRVTALLAIDNTLVVGGEHGVARWDGSRWSRLTDRYQITGLTRAGDRVIASTAQTGLVIFTADFSGLDEHAGNVLPDTLVRDVVPLAQGKMFALTQGPSGSQLAYYDGHRWFGYTTGESGRAQWLGLVPSGEGGAAIVTPGGYYDIVLDRGDDLTPTHVADPGGERHVDLHATVYEPPPPPAPPPAPAPTRRGRRPARPAARPPAARSQHLVPVAFQVGGDAGAPSDATAVSAQTTTASVPPTAGVDAGAAPVVASADAGASTMDAAVARAGDAGRGQAVAANTGDASVAGDATAATTAAATPAAPEVLPPIRVREVPAAGFPIERPSGGPTLDAPTFGLVRGPGDRVPQDTVRVDASRREVFITRIGLGVTRLGTRGGQGPVDFRTHDLAMQRRALSVATDSRNNVWLVSEDGGPVRYDGRTFSRVALEDDAQLHPLLFWSRGATAIAIARVGDGNILRGYRLEGTNWRRVVSGPVELYGPGMAEARFVALDGRGRFWVGLRALPAPGQTGEPRALGVAVLDPENPATIQYNESIPANGGEGGSRRAPNDVTTVDFDAGGNAWLATIDGAVRIGANDVRRFREAEGVRGDLVSDLARTHGNRVYVATSEGLGFIENDTVSFAIDGASTMPRVSALAVDTSGALWGAGARGVWKYDGQTFSRLGRAQGLPGDEYNDLAVDGAGRVWLSNTEGMVLYDPAVHAGD